MNAVFPCYIKRAAASVIHACKTRYRLPDPAWLKGIRLELKKAEHTRPEDEYKLKIENKGIGRKEYDFALDSCPEEIKRQLGEIVLAVYVNDFTDMNNLTADIELREWYFHTEETAV